MDNRLMLFPYKSVSNTIRIPTFQILALRTHASCSVSGCFSGHEVDSNSITAEIPGANDPANW